MSELINSDTNSVKLRVWDLPTRIFHWLLVVTVGFLWYSGENADDMDRHMQVGSIVLTLILFRVVWGLVGSTSARFASFVRPVAALHHLKGLKGKSLQPEAGHNPLGGLMVVALLVSLLTQTISGLYTSDEVLSDGPLYAYASAELAEFMAYIHHLNFNILLALVALHVFAIGFYFVVQKTNLVWPMFTGFMAWPALLPQPMLVFRSLGLALAIFVVLFFAVRYALSVLS